MWGVPRAAAGPGAKGRGRRAARSRSPAAAAGPPAAPVSPSGRSVLVLGDGSLSSAQRRSLFGKAGAISPGKVQRHRQRMRRAGGDGHTQGRPRRGGGGGGGEWCAGRRGFGAGA